MAAATDERLIYEILSAVGEIPEGNVATYGQIARLVGRPKNARLVGRVLSQAERYGDYPCHRVVDHSGRLVPGWDAQAAMLAPCATRSTWICGDTSGSANESARPSAPGGTEAFQRVKKASQRWPPAGGKKVQSFSRATCA